MTISQMFESFVRVTLEEPQVTIMQAEDSLASLLLQYLEEPQVTIMLASL